MKAAILFGVTVDLFFFLQMKLESNYVAHLNLQQCRGTDPAHAQQLHSYKILAPVCFFLLLCKIRSCPHKVPKSQQHSAHVKFAAAAASLGEQSGGCVCVHASVGAHVAEGRSLAEYRLEEEEVLINACGEGRGGWRGFHSKNITLGKKRLNIHANGNG